MTKLYERTAAELAALIRTGAVSSREVVEAHLARIDEENGHVNAITVVLRESALADADAADSRAPTRPLHGVPFTIKENIDCLDSATTHGVPALEHAMPYVDAPVVSRLRAAGAIPIGRTNLSEMGLRVSTDNPLRGRTLNPWNPELTPAGSSGGDAAALATGMTPLGIGTDMGGSLRNPAYCCGVATLKPTTGRIPHASSLPPLDHGMAGQAMLVTGPMARSVGDLRLALRVLAGRDIRDPRSVNAPLEGPDPDVSRAALVTRLPGANIAADTLAAIDRAGDLLAAAGWTVERAEPPELERVSAVWGELLATDFFDLLPTMRPTLTASVSDHMTRMCYAFDVEDRSNHALHAERSHLTRQWSEFLSTYPVAIGPTLTCPPWPVDADLDPHTGIEMLRRATIFIMPGNVLGLPSIALPTGVVDGLPTGIQIYADLWREDRCLAAAEIIEAGVDAGIPIDSVGRPR